MYDKRSAPAIAQIHIIIFLLDIGRKMDQAKRAFIVSRIFSKQTYERYVSAIMDYLNGEKKKYKGDNLHAFLDNKLIEAGFGTLPNDRARIVDAIGIDSKLSSSRHITWKEIEYAFFKPKSSTASKPLRELIPKKYQKETAALHTPKVKSRKNQ